MSDPTTSQLETHRQFAERHGVSTRTVDRWSEDGILPEPVRIRGRKYWPSTVEPQRDGETA
jgi:DNA-binding transcriptional MerR regulator